MKSKKPESPKKHSDLARYDLEKSDPALQSKFTDMFARYDLEFTADGKMNGEPILRKKMNELAEQHTDTTISPEAKKKIYNEYLLIKTYLARYDLERETKKELISGVQDIIKDQDDPEIRPPESLIS